MVLTFTKSNWADSQPSKKLNKSNWYGPQFLQLQKFDFDSILFYVSNAKVQEWM